MGPVRRAGSSRPWAESSAHDDDPCIKGWGQTLTSADAGTTIPRMDWRARWQRLRDLTLAAKLYWALFAVLATMAGAVSIVVVTSLRNNARDLIAAREVKELAVTSLVLLLTQDDITKAILLEPEKLDLAARKVEAYDANLVVIARMDSLSSSPQVSDLIRQIRDLGANQLQPLDARILQAMGEGQTVTAKRLYFTEYDSLRNIYEGLVRDLGAAADTAAAGAAAQMTARNRRAMVNIMVALGLGLGLVAITVFLAGRSLDRRLGATVGLLEAVAVGDLTQRLDVTSRDELGRMGESANRMISDLRTMIGETQATSRQLAASSDGIVRTATGSAEAVRQLNLVIEQISAGATEQAGASQETVQVLTEMSAAIKDVAQGAVAMATTGDETVRAARSGGETVEQAIKGMDSVRQTVLDAATSVRELFERSEKISKINETMTTIASQTNLLSLNATIEAARAGDSGRGFAVVAAEVRKLAELSEAATREIARLIAGIRQGTAAVAKAMENGTRQVDTGAEQTRLAVLALGSILAAVDHTNRQAQGISKSAQTLTNLVDRVSDLATNVASIAEENAAAAEEMAAQSVEVAQGIQRISATSAEGDGGDAQSLKRMAHELQQLVARCRV
jgi:methyl-accepting chemotaxis protein